MQEFHKAAIRNKSKYHHLLKITEKVHEERTQEASFLIKTLMQTFSFLSENMPLNSI